MAVHFVLHGLLGAGVSSTSNIDALGKVSLLLLPVFGEFAYRSRLIELGRIYPCETCFCTKNIRGVSEETLKDSLKFYCFL